MTEGLATRRGGMWVLLVLLVLLAPAAPAQTAASAPKVEAIRGHMQKGQALYMAGKYAEAAKVFEAGFEDYPYSAFLFNAGVCHQKSDDLKKALASFERYIQVDPSVPDRAKVERRIADLKKTVAAREARAEAEAAEAAKAAADAGAPPADAGTSTPPSKPAPVPELDAPEMKSLVVIETHPPGAPIELFAQRSYDAKPFARGKPNPGWEQVATGTSPSSYTLDVGRYHLVVREFRDFNASEADIVVSPGHVHQFKAELSQGAFMAFLRVSSSVPGAFVYFDDPKKERSPWGKAPHGEMVATGEHSVLVEAPGYKPFERKLKLERGQQEEVYAELQRVDFGYVAVDSNAPEIEVRIDGALQGKWKTGDPPLRVKLVAGRHRIQVSGSGRKTYEGSVEVPPGQVLPVHAQLIPTYPRGAAWTQAIIGAVFVGAGIFMGLESNRLYDEVEADRNAGVLAEDDSRLTRGKVFAIVADASFVVGGVLGILATYNFLKDPLPDSSKKEGKPHEFSEKERRAPAPPPAPAGALQLDLGPRVGPSHAGFVLEGRF